MAQKTATEKDMFLQTFERETAITTKLLKAYPVAQGDFRPHEKSRSAKELAWTFVAEQSVADMALKGKVDFSKQMPTPPAAYAEAVAAFEKACRETASKVENASEEQLQKIVQFPIGPGKLGDFRCIDVLWTTLQDQVHHRGQFSVYLRMADGKVPSIYGPSADEPWT